MSQAQWQEMMSGIEKDGVLVGILNTYTVTVTSGLGISVNTGRAMIQGFLARSDAAVALTCATADPTNPRIDRAVLHADLSAHTLTVQLLTGTPAGSPVPPALTQTSTIWEISLYQVRVNALQTTLTGGSLTDERGYAVPNNAVPSLGGTISGPLTVTGLVTASGNLTVTGQSSAGNFSGDAGKVTTDGAGNLATNTLATIQSATAVVVGNSGTIATAATGVSLVNPSAAVTGVILQAGTVGGQRVTVVNIAVPANTVTFAAAATSNVIDGVSDVIAGQHAAEFVWTSGGSRWYRIYNN
jgi:hypothetical protein